MKRDYTLGDQIGYHLTIHKPIDRIEYKNFTGNKTALKLVDKVIVPRGLVPSAILLLV